MTSRLNPLADDWRLHGLDHYAVLKHRGDPVLQRIARLAAAVAGTSAAGIHVLTDTLQHRIASVNAPLDDWPVRDSMCRLAVELGQAVVTTDATTDERFAYSSFVGGDSPVRFYASVPLHTAVFGALGTLCVWDGQPREGAGDVLSHLQDLGAIVVDALEASRTMTLLAELAVTDQLTGAANRRQVEDELLRRLARRRRAGEPLAIAFIDLDGFKAINDTHGHAVGDEVLTEVAGRMRGSVRGDEMFGRLGGDEFVVMGGEGMATEQAISRFVDVFARPVPTRVGPVAVGASIGVALAGDDDTVDSLLGRADTAMFDVKRQGRPG